MIKNIILVILAIIICVLTFEVGSRFILPISAGAQKIDPFSNARVSIPFNQPNATYNQLFSEYNASTHIDNKGNRISPTSNIHSDIRILFLGDSFTFGQGVSDSETIPSHFCAIIKANCINLGIPGTGPLRQYEKINEYLSKVKQQKETHLFHLILASTEARHSGNDIMDNLRELEESKLNKGLVVNQDQKISEIMHPGFFIKFARWLSVKSNAFRVVRTIFGNQLRTLAWSYSGDAFTNDELDKFSHQINKLILLLEKNEITYMPVLLSTYAELTTTKREITLKKIEDNTGIKFIEFDFLKTDYETSFFPLDGHLNNYGNKFIATELAQKFKIKFNE